MGDSFGRPHGGSSSPPAAGERESEPNTPNFADRRGYSIGSGPHIGGVESRHTARRTPARRGSEPDHLPARPRSSHKTTEVSASSPRRGADRRPPEPAENSHNSPENEDRADFAERALPNRQRRSFL